jgi:chromosome segregation ATPase
MARSEDKLKTKLDAAREQLQAVLERREQLEKRVEEAELELAERKEALREVLDEEGRLRGAIGGAERAGAALEELSRVDDSG